MVDRINMNAFREIKAKKHGTKQGENIYAKPKPKNPNQKFTRPMPPSVDPFTGEKIHQNFNEDVLKNENVDLYYANPNSFKNETQVTVNKNGVITRTNGTGITTIQAMVNNPKNKNQPEAYQYRVQTKKVEDPDLDMDNLSLKKQTKEEMQMAKMQTDIFINAVKSNKLTRGTQEMMDNERLHAQEAIESGIYVTWSTQSKGGKTVDCFRVGSNSVCICNHGFKEHDCVLTKNKFSIKCKKCKCREFKYMPQFPEEIGEYWIPYQKNFSYITWKAKCKCKHGYNEHNVESFVKCKKCGCGMFESSFCCAVCNKFWQDHEMIYELEPERKSNGKPVANDYIPFAELPEMYDALYK